MPRRPWCLPMAHEKSAVQTHGVRLCWCMLTKDHQDAALPWHARHAHSRIVLLDIEEKHKRLPNLLSAGTVMIKKRTWSHAST